MLEFREKMTLSLPILVTVTLLSHCVQKKKIGESPRSIHGLLLLSLIGIVIEQLLLEKY